MTRGKLFLKAASFTLLICFIVQDFSFAAGEIKPVALNLFEKPKVSLKFPDSVARVEDSFFFEQGPEGAASRSTLEKGGSRLASLARTRRLPRLVYLLQDAHTNTSGQINLSKALDHLLKEDKSLKYVFVEAGVGNNSLSFLRQQATPKKRKQVAEEFVRKGLLHGEEYLDMTTNRPFTIFGVEDPSLYSQSLELYRKSAKQREKFQSYLDKVEGAVKSLKTKIYNPAFLIMDEKREKFLKEEMSLTDYIDALQKKVQFSSSSDPERAERVEGESRSTLENAEGSSRRARFTRLLEQEGGSAFYPHLRALQSLKTLESQINFQKATEEQQKAILSLSSEDQKEVLSYLKEDKTKPFAGGGIEDLQRKEAFYSLLQEKLEKGDSHFFPQNKTADKKSDSHLFRYLQYLKQAQKISPQEILKEQKLLEDQVFQTLAQTQDEQILFKVSKNVRDLRKLFNLTLTSEEYQTYEKDPRGFNIAFITGFLNRKIMDLGTLYEKTTLLEQGYEDAIKTCEEFYKLTTQRDEAFIENMFQKLSSSSGSKVAFSSSSKAPKGPRPEVPLKHSMK